MASASTNNTFSDSAAARILALILAAICAFLIFNFYSNDLKQLFSSGQQTELPATTVETAPEEAANPVLAQCLQQRIGDVDRMREEGILSDDQYASFRSRAEELCVQQNQ